jgi:hypothetical protein
MLRNCDHSLRLTSPLRLWKTRCWCFRDGETYMECKKYVLVQKEIKSRENRRTTKRSWQKVGRQIWGHPKPHTLQESKPTTVEVRGADPGTWSRVDMKKQVKNSLSIAILNNSRTQATLHLNTRHWATSWVTQVILIWLMISTLEHLHIDPSQIVISRQL